ncbi:MULTISPECIES: permease prefix domain 1-containing protein [unclassified Breznakia]|uniref:permease prefix domain 1-containing protein n=1 Tax=unclassified Breznakia TaxID=2623764 RepID=UPI002474A58F|nr:MULTISPECIES: permease prefix domain 1-containing protein [unclassified Breznakia]MDH6366851.1 putative membrane protein [Breznakia sp. PH1-1]MDH6404029.1 putative membrane protein [Breznakia sp. PF1-11]MDH6411749.1 putative membrane protein [Breznakia sp. PFB1-11]MDH6414017.1 putative membrane protein [Breznakia sp. PFB1-14]MDH6416447.1 putative membrane protein [Breznakia sp. PFB1-4]
METIRAYLEQMFKDLPKTKEVAEMKMNLQDHMEDAYHEYREAGMSETDAIKEVLQQFGDMDELLRELNIEKESISVDARYVSSEDAHTYIRKYKKQTTLVCIGLVCIFAGLSLGYVASELYSFGFANALSGIFFFFPIACAVGLFIYAGMSMDGYKYMKDMIELDYQTKTEIIQAYEKSKLAFVVEIIIGVLCFISAVAGYTVIEYVFKEVIANVTFFALIALGVVLCVHAGTTKTMYRTLLNDNYEELQNEKQAAKASDKVAPVAWILATAIYVTLGMIYGWWATAWVVYLFALAVIVLAEAIHK